MHSAGVFPVEEQVGNYKAVTWECFGAQWTIIACFSSIHWKVTSLAVWGQEKFIVTALNIVHCECQTCTGCWLRWAFMVHFFLATIVTDRDENSRSSFECLSSRTLLWPSVVAWVHIQRTPVTFPHTLAAHAHSKLTEVARVVGNWELSVVSSLLVTIGPLVLPRE